MVDSSSTYRLRAVAAEHRARIASDADAKKEWEELAIQWHLLAGLAAQYSDSMPQIDFA
jgi:hypothetical protein